MAVGQAPFLNTPGFVLVSFTIDVIPRLNKPRLSPEPFAQVKAKLHWTARPLCTWLKLLSVKSRHCSGSGGLPTLSAGVSSVVVWFALSVAVTRALYRPSGKPP